jgi:hypothetical protein
VPANADKAATTEPDLSAFLRDLSELCRRHGLGITGTPILFVMEPEDYQLSYVADADRELLLG